jgi:hypothetical protein
MLTNWIIWIPPFCAVSKLWGSMKLHCPLPREIPWMLRQVCHSNCHCSPIKINSSRMFTENSFHTFHISSPQCWNIPSIPDSPHTHTHTHTHNNNNNNNNNNKLLLRIFLDEKWICGPSQPPRYNQPVLADSQDSAVARNTISEQSAIAQQCVYLCVCLCK